MSEHNYTMKPCPFCGGDGAFTSDPPSNIVCGSCWSCGARGPAVRYRDAPTHQDFVNAIKLWNERTMDKPTPIKVNKEEYRL